MRELENESLSDKNFVFFMSQFLDKLIILATYSENKEEYIKQLEQIKTDLRSE